jgi:hypothetical protein
MVVYSFPTADLSGNEFEFFEKFESSGRSRAKAPNAKEVLFAPLRLGTRSRHSSCGAQLEGFWQKCLFFQGILIDN